MLEVATFLSFVFQSYLNSNIMKVCLIKVLPICWICNLKKLNTSAKKNHIFKLTKAGLSLYENAWCICIKYHIKVKLCRKFHSFKTAVYINGVSLCFKHHIFHQLKYKSTGIHLSMHLFFCRNAKKEDIFCGYITLSQGQVKDKKYRSFPALI